MRGQRTKDPLLQPSGRILDTGFARGRQLGEGKGGEWRAQWRMALGWRTAQPDKMVFGQVWRLTDTVCRLATMAASGSKQHATYAVTERDEELLVIAGRGFGATLILLLLAVTGFLFIQEIGSIFKAPSQSITGSVATELVTALHSVYEALQSLYTTFGQLAWTLNAAMYGPDFSTSRLLSAAALRKGVGPLATCLAPTGHHSHVQTSAIIACNGCITFGKLWRRREVFRAWPFGSGRVPYAARFARILRALPANPNKEMWLSLAARPLFRGPLRLGSRPRLLPRGICGNSCNEEIVFWCDCRSKRIAWGCHALGPGPLLSRRGAVR